MKVSVYDTYVRKNCGALMHFDILVDENTSITDVYKYGKEYLTLKKIVQTNLSAEECRFCHIEEAPKKVIDSINKKGFYIIEMENCN